MTYSGMGAYYADTPGFQMPYEAVGAFGVLGPAPGGTSPVDPSVTPGVTFDANAVWADVEFMNKAYVKFAADTAGLSASSAAYQSALMSLGTANYKSRQVANRLRAVLGQLGYDTDPAIDTMYGSSKDCSAYRLFLSDNGLTPHPYSMCGVSKAGFDRLQQVNDQWLRDRVVPGPKVPTNCVDLGGGNYQCPGPGPGPGPGPVTPVPKPKPKSGFNLGLFALIAGAAVVAGVIVTQKKKKKPGAKSSGGHIAYVYSKPTLHLPAHMPRNKFMAWR